VVLTERVPGLSDGRAIPLTLPLRANHTTNHHPSLADRHTSFAATGITQASTDSPVLRPPLGAPCPISGLCAAHLAALHGRTLRHAAYASILRPFEDLLSPVQKKKLEMASRRMQD